MADFKCRQCGFFELTDPVNKTGDCRMNAPKLKGWPMVSVGDWCGEFEPSDEEIALATMAEVE